MKKDEKIQWHPAFADALKLELEDFKDILTFEEEHQLTMKPLEVDILVIKKTKNVPILVNIARIFEEHNIIEYKSPNDRINIDHFYKVLAYTYLYKIRRNNKKEIPFEEMTFTIAGYSIPNKLFRHLEENDYKISKKEEGIYYIEGSIPKGQIIIIDQLPPKINRFIRLLTRKLNIKDEIEGFLRYYNKDDTRHEHLLEIIENVNYEQFMEVFNMPRELSKRELELTEKVVEKLGLDKKWMEKGEQQGEKKGKAEGLAEGLAEGKADGKNETRIETAKEMLLLNCDIEFVAKITKLSKEEIIKIKESMDGV